MSTLTVTLPDWASVVDGKQITFRAPCDCTGVTGIIINDTTYSLVDANNVNISSKGNQFVNGAMVSVIIDTENSRAYIQNTGAHKHSKSDIEDFPTTMTPSTHNHDAGDITSGTLAVERGGTGQTSLQDTRNAMGLGDTTGALPIENGGTGTDNASTARTNLGITVDWLNSVHNHKSSGINPTTIELTGDGSDNGGYIDFHYNNSTEDYTSRIIEEASGKLNVTAVNGVVVSSPAIETFATRNIKASTTDLTAGTSSLNSGDLYFVYE